MTRARRGSSAENSIATSLNFCSSASDGATFPTRHRRSDAAACWRRRRVLDEQREIDERDVRQLRRRVEPDPALVGRIEMIDDAALREKLFAALALLVHEAGHWRRRRSDVQRLGTIGGPRRDPN